MEWLYEKSRMPGGGQATRSGQFHVSFRSGSRGNGACARSSYDYVTREGQYEGGDRDPAIYTSRITCRPGRKAARGSTGMWRTSTNARTDVYTSAQTSRSRETSAEKSRA